MGGAGQRRSPPGGAGVGLVGLRAVAGAGDVNKDGFADVIIGAYENSVLVGYSVSFVTEHFHYSDLTIAQNDLLFLIGSPNCFNEEGMQTKLGRVRLHFTPAVFTKDFRQELDLARSEKVRRMWPFLRDVYDHLSRSLDMIEMQRDLLNGSLDIYLSSLNNRMNAVMKVLTIIATIFMPLTFLAVRNAAST